MAISNRNPGSKTYASDTWADITRAQWQDYQARFVPYENELIGQLTYDNPAIVQNEINKGTQTASSAYDTANRMNQQNVGLYGAALTQGYQQQQNRTNQTQRSAAVVNEANRIRQELQDQNRQIALGMSNSAVTAAEVK